MVWSCGEGRKRGFGKKILVYRGGGYETKREKYLVGSWNGEKGFGLSSADIMDHHAWRMKIVGKSAYTGLSGAPLGFFLGWVDVKCCVIVCVWVQNIEPHELLTCIFPALPSFKKIWLEIRLLGEILFGYRYLIFEVMMVERSEEYWSIYFEELFCDVSDIKVYVTPQFYRMSYYTVPYIQQELYTRSVRGGRFRKMGMLIWIKKQKGINLLWINLWFLFLWHRILC